MVFVGLVVSASRADPGQDNRAPELTGAATNLVVPAGHKVHFRCDAAGVQIYTNDVARSAWVFKAPEAVLFGADGNMVGIHYAGPTWESKSGSTAVGRVVTNAPAANTIPWLLLEARTAAGPGILESTTYIQRVNTAGGRAPATPPSPSDGEVRVPYTAEYYFYRKIR
jgi:hypothetical protein